MPLVFAVACHVGLVTEHSVDTRRPRHAAVDHVI
jgi:hypothetical protein